ncbi:hypothetical protein Tco_0554178 [Tanacetum coccineum]
MAPRGRPTRLNPNATPTPVTDTHTTTSVSTQCSKFRQLMINERRLQAHWQHMMQTRNGNALTWDGKLQVLRPSPEAALAIALEDNEKDDDRQILSDVSGSDADEKYVDGLPDTIHGTTESATQTRDKTLESLCRRRKENGDRKPTEGL